MRSIDELRLKNLQKFLSLLLIMAASFTYSQTDTARNKMMPPDFNNDKNRNQDLINDVDSLHHYDRNRNRQINEQDIPGNRPAPQKTPHDINKNDNLKHSPTGGAAPMPTDKKVSNGIVMKKGKAVMIKNGSSSMIERDMTLSDGTMIKMNGSISRKDGTAVIIKEGEYMDMDGKIKSQDK